MEKLKVGDFSYARQNELEEERSFKSKEFAFSDSFKEFIAQESHQGLMFAVKKVIDSTSIDSNEVGKKIEGDGFSLECLGDNTNTQHRKYFRLLTTDGQGDFFIKVNTKIPGFHELGPEELLIMQEAKNKLGEVTDFKVTVPEYVLAYKDRETSYLVARYDDNLRNPVNKLLEREPEGELATVLKNRVLYLSQVNVEKGWNYDDVTSHNMAYDKDTDTLIVFDLRRPYF